MEILIIGNGLDLAHKLPTQYMDFLKFVDVIKQVNKIKKPDDLKQINWREINTDIKAIIEANMGNVRYNLFSQQDVWAELVGDNIWIEYFLQCNMYQKKNWIDFESEISNVIQELDENKGKNDLEKSIGRLSNKFFNEKYLNSQADLLGEILNGTRIANKKNPITYGQLLKKLEDDLARLIRALEIYLTDYVEKINIVNQISEIAELTPSHVLSFNYTNTYERIYGMNKNIKYNYIHGKANTNSNVDSSNLVLGIDEYLDESRKNKDLELITFKKYYQRIYKGTGNDYQLWIDEIKEEWNNTSTDSRREIRRRISENNFDNTYEKMHKLYIFGHSLDITDTDVLRSFILNVNVRTSECQ